MRLDTKLLLRRAQQQLVYEDPRSPAEATRSITVQQVTLTLEILPEPPYEAGQMITLRATLTLNGAPWPGELVGFWISVAGLPATTIGEVPTDAYGVATLMWTIPWEVRGVTIPCKTATWGAHHRGTCQPSNEVSAAVAYPTWLQIFAPDTVPADRDFEIYGFLSYESSPGVWTRIPDATVTLYYNETLIGSVTTDADGRYSIITSIPTAGTYTLRAVYAGEGLGLAPAFAILGLEVPSEVVLVVASISVGVLFIFGGVIA